MNGKRYVLVNTLTMECYYSKTFKALATAAKLSRRQVKYMYDSRAIVKGWLCCEGEETKLNRVNNPYFGK